MAASGLSAMTVADLPRAGLARILAELGPSLLELVCGDVERADEAGGIGGIVIYDPLDTPEFPERALVLGVGLHDPADVVTAIRDVGAHEGVALLVRAPVEADSGVRAVVSEFNVPVLGLSRGASWTHVWATLRALVANEFELDAESVGRTGAGMRQIVGYQSGLDDLFAVANAVAALVDAPITIEDRSSRLLAFSSRQEDVDEVRVQTILRRQVPEEYTRVLARRGVFQDIYRSTGAVYVGPVASDEPDDRGRAAVAVRAGDEILGTIWAIVSEPLDAERAHAMADAARLVAMHLVWQRTDADIERRLRAELLNTALESGSRSREAIQRLGLKDEAAIVLALTVAGGDGEHPLPAQLAVERKRLADAFALHLTAIYPRSAAGLIGDVSYGIVPVTNTTAAEERAAKVAVDFLARIDSALRPLIGIGPLVPGSSALEQSRSGADRALRVLRSRGCGPQVALLDDVHIEALLLELADFVPRGELPSGAVARLAAYDDAHQGSLLDTLRAWLEAFGDTVAASKAMYVHANTFRYRLRRAAEVGKIDLDDPHSRFAVMLQLRLLDLSAPPPDR